MIAHQTIAKNADSGVLEVLAYEAQIGGAVLVRGESFAAINTSLRDVTGDLGKQTSAARAMRRLV